jgi:hypothetical protein
MGRPPIGKVAMTGAERTRLYRRRHPTTAKPSSKTYETRIRELEAQIRNLEAQLARKRKQRR